MDLIKFFKGVLGTIGIFTVIPFLAAFIGNYFYPIYSQMQIFLVTIVLVWIISIELRINKLMKKGKRK